MAALQGVAYNPFPTKNTCKILVNNQSPVLWDLSQPSEFLRYTLPRVHLQLAVVFSLTQFLQFILRRFHLPRFTSELLAGIILGPTVLGQIPNFTYSLFPPAGVHLDILSQLGYAFFMFLSVVKMNPKLVLTSGAGNITAWSVGTVAALIPFAGSLSLANFCKRVISPYQMAGLKAIASVQNIFSFPVIFSLLNDLKIMNSELGRLALTSALISDLVSNTLLLVAANIRMGFAGWNDMIGFFNLLLMLAAIYVLIAPAQPLSRWIIAQTPEGRPINRGYVIIISGAVLSAGLLTCNTGLQYHHGPFILGLALPDGPPLGSTLVLKLETLVYGLFAPLLVSVVGLKMDLVRLYDIKYLLFLSKVIVGCVTLKYVAVLFPALVSNMPVKDAFTLSFIMSTQGIVQLYFYHLFFVMQVLLFVFFFHTGFPIHTLVWGILVSFILVLQSFLSFLKPQTIDQEIFSVVSFSLLVTATSMQMCAYTLYDRTRTYAGYQKRDIQYMSYNAELRVLVSSSRADDAFAVKKILEASFPNRECPLAVYAVTLVELVGRAHPLLIDHQLGQKSSTVVGPHVQKILEVFHLFREQYMGMVSVQMFTAMSLPKFMHDDICSLAFDKMTSVIILPFHVKWNNQGHMIANNGSVRAMNCNVLDMAPCSVGILVDRHRIKTSEAQSSTYDVAIIFIGGNDDREALAYGIRMARSPGVHLTVVRFVPWDPAAQNQWDAVMDAELLKETRLQSADQDNIVYKEEEVKDGAETALLIHAMEDGFDLIIVGRRHRDDSPQLLGLNEWNDLPELGSVGDMLASGEIKKPVSIFVVQQQILRIN